MDLGSAAFVDSGMTYSILFCNEHGNQGHRTICRWCDTRLIPKNLPEGTRTPVWPASASLEVGPLFIPLDVLHDQFQDLPDVY